jgi:4-amino-4-deoxy-L-arabinose transferase-like glycosyltransferase
VSPRARRDARIALLVAVAVFALQLPVRLCSVNLMDEGAILQIADGILHGHHPYADAMHYAFPGVFYLTAAAFAVGGTTVETARTLAAALFALASALVYLLARWSHGRRGALAAVLAFLVYRVWAYPHWQMINYSPLAVTLVLLAAWLVGEALPAGRPALLVGAGVAAALAILAKQDSGLAGAAALAVATLLCPRGARTRALAAFAAGAGATLAAAGAAIVAAGFAPDMVRETILAPLYGVRHFEYWPAPSGRSFRQDAERGISSRTFPILLDPHWSRYGELTAPARRR